MQRLFLFACVMYVSPCFSTRTAHDTMRLHEFAMAAYSTRETVYNTFELAERCLELNIVGDFVECGVAAGTQAAAMAYACQKLHVNNRKVHMFDSFEGIPLAGPNDDQQPGIGAIQHDVHSVINLDDLLVSSGITVHSLTSVQANMARWDIPAFYCVYHKGWFQHTLPIVANSIQAISVLRLDGDLYESTKVCLEHLYHKISKGGYIIIDDYRLTGCRKAVDEYLKRHNISPRIQEIVGGLGPVYWQIE